MKRGAPLEGEVPHFVDNEQLGLGVEHEPLLQMAFVVRLDHLRNDVLEDLRFSRTSAWTPSGTRACCSSASPNCAVGCPWPSTSRSASASTVRHHIGASTATRLDAYLEHRLRLAGCELPLFEPPAVEALF